MKGYTKLFASILASTVWQESKETRLLWVTMLAASDQFGHVNATIPGLAHLAGLTIEETEAGLAILEAPDPYSRTEANEGRRIERAKDGWQLVNHAKYREIRNQDDRREYQKEYQKARRRAHKHAINNCKQLSTTSTAVNRGQPEITHTDTEADTKKRNIYSKFFEAWWGEYPRRLGKAAAAVAYEKAVKALRGRSDAPKPHEYLIAAVRKFRDSDQGRGDVQYIPHPATWLNQGRYDDEPVAQRGGVVDL